ncbi:MAG: DEAD/DEAH box helicase family protein, partial [Flavobacteriales bacterium]|nr:DEAD/DEAH box helicase family protein [Flavobacteriales bacterium]
KLVLYPDKKIDYSTLSDKEYLVVEALEVRNTLTLLEVSEVLSVKNVHTFIQSLIQKQVIVVYEEVKDKFKPKMVAYLKLTAFAAKEENLKLLFDEVSNSKKQLSALMAFVQLSNRYQKNQQPVEKIVLQKTANVSAAIINKLVEKGIFEVYEQQKNRFDDYANALITDATLNEHQQQAFTAIKQKFETKDVVLLHGVTGSGKTEIYIKLIKEALEKGEQVLYLLPEIALTTQLIVRLQKVFGDTIGVYHSKFNENERVEVWNEVLNFNENLAKKSPQRFQIVMGARSSMFLPFSKLGLIIIDEEHENTFKQFDPAPRYHARDTSIVL